MVLQGAELLFYPTAIGSEVQDPTIDSMEHWRVVQRGHSGANLVPVDRGESGRGRNYRRFYHHLYGSSFITDEHGALVEEADRRSETVLVHQFDLDALEQTRLSWGVFRDRRPDIYGPLLTYDGVHRHIGAKGAL